MALSSHREPNLSNIQNVIHSAIKKKHNDLGHARTIPRPRLGYIFHITERRLSPSILIVVAQPGEGAGELKELHHDILGYFGDVENCFIIE